MGEWTDELAAKGIAFKVGVAYRYSGGQMRFALRNEFSTICLQEGDIIMFESAKALDYDAVRKIDQPGASLLEGKIPASAVLSERGCNKIEGGVDPEELAFYCTGLTPIVGHLWDSYVAQTRDNKGSGASVLDEALSLLRRCPVGEPYAWFGSATLYVRRSSIFDHENTGCWDLAAGSTFCFRDLSLSYDIGNDLDVPITVLHPRNARDSERNNWVTLSHLKASEMLIPVNPQLPAVLFQPPVSAFQPGTLIRLNHALQVKLLDGRELKIDSGASVTVCAATERFVVFSFRDSRGFVRMSDIKDSLMPKGESFGAALLGVLWDTGKAFGKAVTDPQTSVQGSSELRIDSEGYLYERNFLGEWVPRRTAMGTQARDVNLLGSPRIRRGLFGPVRGREGLGSESETKDGKPLYEPDSQ